MARSLSHQTAFDNSGQAAPLRHPASFTLSVVIAALVCLLPATAARAARSCEEWSAELMAVEGTVEVQSSGNRDWTMATSGQRICSGDTVRVEASSRATVTLPDGSMLRLDEHTTFAFPEPESGVGSLIELLRGVIHVISRDPRSLRFTTPYANAGLEGTEFDIRVSDAERQTEVVVLEGEVLLTTPSGSIEVTSGSIGTARAGQAATSTPVARPIELMRWAARYQPIIDEALPDPDQAPSPQQLADADFFAKRAAAHLATARLESARSDLAASQRLAPRNQPALALEAMLALAHGDRAAARQLAAAAAQATPKSAMALLAFSHVQQSDGELAAAERSARQALELEPDNALALTQLAEITLAQGNATASIAYATRAQTLAPTRSDPATVLGFAQLRGFDLNAARTAFTHATAIEPAAPLPRLGLALTAIQEGDLIGGRQQLEIAVALDPADALTRSYMAKVYSAEHRDDLTTSQLDLAMEFDPQDPTPWLYAAMQNLRSNRPIEALQDLRAATERNGHRTILRSRLGMDEDLATRSGGLGRVHTELGFGQLALVEAWHAVADEPADYANHRLLADVYSATPRHEIARVSELLVSQLLQPINITPIKAQLAQPSLFIAEHSGPSYTSFNEFGPPVTANGLQFQLSSSGGGNDTVGEDVAVAGLHDGLSYSVGQYRFATDGFRTNNDLDQRTANAFIQFRPSTTTSLQGELRSTRTERGDLALLFDPLLYDSMIRIGEDTDSIRFGGRHDVTPKDTLLASVIYQEVDLDLTVGAPFANDTARDSYGVDLQLLHTFGSARFQGGLSYTQQDDVSTTYLALPELPAPLTSVSPSTQRATSVYSYAHFAVRPTLTITAGASLDQLRDPLVDDDSFSPKLGVLWRPTPHTTVRAAAFESLFSSLTTSRQNPQPRLEPTQVAGFSQLLFGGTADHSTVSGLAVDHALAEHVYIGWEASHRDTDRTVADLRFGAPSALEVALTERVQQAYLYWTPHDRVSLNARYELGRYHSTPLELFGYSTMNIERLPIEVRYFSPTGLTAGLRASHIREDGIFLQTAAAPGLPPGLAPGSDTFWVLDAFIGYRLPNRRGLLSLSADNLLDKRFQFQDVDAETPTVMPELLLSMRFTIAFD